MKSSKEPINIDSESFTEGLERHIKESEEKKTGRKKRNTGGRGKKTT